MWNTLLSGPAAWFTVPALIGTVFFAFRLVMLLLGSGHAMHFGDLHAGDVHVGSGSSDAHHDSGHDFRILSIQSIAAFMMGFGWGGVGAMRGAGWAMGTSMLVAIACGIGMMWLLGLLLRALVSLHQSGTVSLDRAIGQSGEVYVTVTRATGGQVRVTMGDRQRICNARTLGEELPTGTRVTVLGVDSDNSLTIART
jgi:hypothetical protein